MSAPQTDQPASPLVRVEEASLGLEGQVRLVVSGVSDPERLRAPWASSGAVVELVGGRLRATSTVQALIRAAGRSLGRDEASTLDRLVRDAVAAWSGPARDLRLPQRVLAARRRPLVMGVVNVTPDSFSDGGSSYDAGDHPGVAVSHAEQLRAEGADLLDIGGESTRPGAEPVDEVEELDRVLPVIETLAERDTVISIDTTKPEVAQAALKAGALIVNDVSGARDPALLEVAAAHGAGYVLMHTRGTPKDMQSHASYGDVVAEVYEHLAGNLQRCVDAGIDEECIAVDPGIGFAKTAEHNVQILRALRQFRGLGRPVVVGVSRKSFLGELLDGAPVEERLEASLACAAAAVLEGAAMVRVHDVAPTVKALRVAHALQGQDPVWPAEVLEED